MLRITKENWINFIEAVASAFFGAVALDAGIGESVFGVLICKLIGVCFIILSICEFANIVHKQFPASIGSVSEDVKASEKEEEKNNG